jgi:mannose/fructose-specific phosphotransferase system component IIA
MKSTDRVRFISHEAKQILLLDFTNCSPEEVKSASDEAERVITAQPQNSVLVLADFSGAQFSRDAVIRIKEVTTCDRPFVKRAAWVNTENLPKVLYDAIARFSQRQFPTFPTREQALDYLAED